MRLRLAIVAAVTSGLLAVTAGVVPARALVGEGCVLVYPARTACTYTATQVASFVGIGPFRIQVSFVDGQGHVRTRYDLTQTTGPYSSAGTTDTHQIGIGDIVSARVLGLGGALAVGNPGAVPQAAPPSKTVAPRLVGDTSPVHDPAIATSGGWYYLFSTGVGILVRRSRDLVHWTADGTVFGGALPPWASTLVPGTQFPWAPDISFFGGRWHLYYTISTFGSKRSVIGLATNPTLDRSDPRFGWRDEGPVIGSHNLTDVGIREDYNALDPNLVLSADGTPHLVFGSFYAGVQVVPVDLHTGKPTTPVLPVPLATNVQEYTAIEAPFMIVRDGWYYLFASYDYCCRGIDSTYNVRVGRARSIEGPFVDDVGVPMLVGGGRLVLSSHGDMRGPGHNAAIRVGNQWELVFHWYDAARDGAPTLGILPVHWTANGWPTV